MKDSRALCDGSLVFLRAFAAEFAPVAHSPRWWRSIRLIDGIHWLSRAHPVYSQSMAKSKDKKPKAKTNKAKLTAKEKKERKLKKKER